MSYKRRQKSTTKSGERGSYLSPLKRKQIVARRAAGQTVREVAAAEKCGTNTVTKITKSPEGQEELKRLGQEHTDRLRDQFRAIAEKGLKTLAKAVETDPYLAYKMTRGSGIAVYRDEGKIEMVGEDPYLAWSQEDKKHFIETGHRLEGCTCDKSARECGKLEKESVQ